MDRPAEPGPVQEYLDQGTARVQLGDASDDPTRTRPDAGPVRGLVITGGHDHETSFYSLFEGHDDLPSMPVAARHHGLPERSARQVRRADHVRFHARARRNRQEEPPRLRRERQGNRRPASCLAQLSRLALVVRGSRRRPLSPASAKATIPRRPSRTTRRSRSRPKESTRSPPGSDRFEIVDETYKGMYFSPRDRPLLSTTNPNSDRLLAWIGPCSTSRVVAIQLGHGHTAHRNPSYRALVHNAILWAAGRTK